MLFPLAVAALPTPVESSITVVSYNIHHGRGMDGVIDLPRIAKVIASQNPDFVGLQEVDSGTNRAEGRFEAKELGELLGLNSVFAEAMPYDGGGYGEGFLFKGEGSKMGPLRLPARNGFEPRSAAVHKFELGGETCWIFATHLDHQDSQMRADQLAKLESLINELAGDSPAIVMGDLNMRPDSPSWGTWWSRWKSTVIGPTMPSKEPRSQIDYIFVRPPERWDVLRTWIGDEPIASDHAPIAAELKLKR
jgi:endonuclease/exonuclease/phosphatase family metal-dependent hydrolase